MLPESACLSEIEFSCSIYKHIEWPALVANSWLRAGDHSESFPLSFGGKYYAAGPLFMFAKASKDDFPLGVVCVVLGRYGVEEAYGDRFAHSLEHSHFKA